MSCGRFDRLDLGAVMAGVCYDVFLSHNSCYKPAVFVEEALGRRTGETLTTEFHTGHSVEQQAHQQQ